MGAEAIVDKAMGGKFPESQIELTMESWSEKWQICIDSILYEP